MLNEALYLLSLGLSVIPLTRGAKIPPKGCSWKEQQDTLPTKELTIERFGSNPDCNIGIITGIASQVVVIDGDSPEACNWIEKTFPKTWLKVTNYGRGRHYYYRYPQLSDGKIIKSTSSIIRKDVDVRGGGGLVVVPPSIHKSGINYTWVISPSYSLDDIEQLPLCPVDIPGILSDYIEKKDTKKNNYCNGELKNIADKCAWMRHCRSDAKKLSYAEWVWMLSIVARCKDGRNKAHVLSVIDNKRYEEQKTDKKIDEVINNMQPVTCRTIAETFEECQYCSNRNKGNFSPIILSNEISLNEIEIVTEDDICEENMLSTQLSEKILNPGDLISEGMQALSTPDAVKIDQYNLPLVISIIARAIAGKITFSNIWPNFYMVKVGGTSTGKTESDHKIKNMLINFGSSVENFYGPDDFASGPGLLRGLEAQPQCIMSLDEISYLFRRFDKPDPITSGKIDVILQLFTNSGLVFKKPFGDTRRNICINRPYLSIIGNATPDIFDNIRHDDFTSGLMQRFTFWFYAGEIKERLPFLGEYNHKLSNFIEKIVDIFKFKTKNELVDIIDQPTELQIDTKAYDRLREYSSSLRIAANAEEDGGKTGIITRKYNECIKYALVHWASENFNLNRMLNINNINYGIDLADVTGDWKLNILYNKVKTGNFHKLCDVFKEGIAAVIKRGCSPTGKAIADRRHILKNLKPREFNDITKALAARKEIVIDESGISTKYFLVKE